MQILVFFFNFLNLLILELEKFNEMFAQMQDNPEQKAFVEAIIEAINNESDEPKLFFLDGPGGTGKTFLYKALTHLFKSLNKTVKNMASTVKIFKIGLCLNSFINIFKFLITIFYF